MIGTAVSPRVPLPTNSYHWRVRAVDAQGNGGSWNEGSFTKKFSDVTPTVRNVRVRDHGSADLGSAPTTSEPMLAWEPVPGATGYELQFTRREAGGCDWVKRLPERSFTPNPAWAWTAEGPPLRSPGSDKGWPGTTVHRFPQGFGPGSWCVRILAVDPAGNISEWTYVNGQNQSAFTYVSPSSEPEADCVAVDMPAANYREPLHGSSTSRTPLFAWDPVPDARSYFVVLARDPAFLEVVEVGFTHGPQFVPRRTYADETTSYYWAVMPSPRSDGSCIFSQPQDEPYAAFQKRSSPPLAIGPVGGESVAAQPVFRWESAEGTSSYRVQVARDGEFKDLVDNITTASTAYASSTTYPVDTVLYWRVRATDGDRVELNWSPTETFRRRLAVPVPAAENPSGGETIPVLSWSAVPEAISYGLHVDQADGTGRDFTVTSTSFTPTLFYGTGIWRWKVRANFPPTGAVSSGYSAPVEYVRRLGAPGGVDVDLRPDRVAFSWDPDQAAAKYRLEVSKSDAFVSMADSVTTPNTSSRRCSANPRTRTAGVSTGDSQ